MPDLSPFDLAAMSRAHARSILHACRPIYARRDAGLLMLLSDAIDNARAAYAVTQAPEDRDLTVACATALAVERGLLTMDQIVDEVGP